MAKAPSLRKDWSKGTQRTRKLSTGKALWMLEKCEGTLQGVEPWRRTAGVEPGAVKVACRVLNGGDEETCMLQRALSLPNGKGGWEKPIASSPGVTPPVPSLAGVPPHASP
jgi:hypothetical protein